MTDEEIYDAFKKRFPNIPITLRAIKHLIENHNLERFCIPPDTDRPWELRKDNKIQCAICGRWLKFINHAHLKKHGLTAREYKLKFGIKQNFPLASEAYSALLKLRNERRLKLLHQKFPDLFKNQLKNIRPYSYQKPKQFVIERIESGVQKKAAKAPKPRKYRSIITPELIKHLRDNFNLSFSQISQIIKIKFNITLSDTTIKRIYFGTREYYKLKNYKHTRKFLSQDEFENLLPHILNHLSKTGLTS